MKKTILFVLVLAVLFSFSVLENAKEKKTLINLGSDHGLVKVTETMDTAAEQAKKERFIQARNRKEEKCMIHTSVSNSMMFQADKPNAGSMTVDEGSVYFQPDYSGDTVITGLCQNTGTSSAAFVNVTYQLKNSGGALLGEDDSYAWGGTNAQLTASGIFTNILEPGDYGFFKIWTDIDFANVDQEKSKSAWKITWNNYSYKSAGGQLAFDGDVYGEADYFGDLKLSGLIKNSSSTYVTYFTQVAFAVFNLTDTKVVDVDFTFVDGSSYNYGLGSTDTAIYPFESQPFSNTFSRATYADTSDTFRYAFEWDEARASSMPEKNPPFGFFATPIDGANVYSSIPVTGWALDDSGVENVKIYRVQGNTETYIGDATLVEGARPDVAAAFPDYPNNTRAGWGYMLLTNFLPNGGNGTYQIRAIATDGVGKSTTLGTKTIYCDNANAVKPFGAIDTPGQGGTASGGSFVNWGWVLTPQPDSIPTDGSTINVYVDGVSIGHPNYNNYRADIARFFPGLANSNGAAGYFMIDTTAYANGVHTIQWTARDTGNDTDGIGSRYFTISNTTGSSKSLTQTYKAKPGTPVPNLSQVKALSNDYSAPVRVKYGYDEDEMANLAPMDENGMNRVVVPEMERVEIHLSQQLANGFTYVGYLVIGQRMMKLPVGSTLNPKTGVFSWIPGPGHLGPFHLVFVETAPDGTMTKKNTVVEIVPKQYKSK
jgi:hypothetical protein